MFDAVRNSDLALSTESFVRDVLRSHDSSHDFFHIERVVGMAKIISAQEGVIGRKSIERIVLSCLTHDVGDHKYCENEKVGQQRVREFLTGQNYEDVEQVMNILGKIGFSKELGSEEKGEGGEGGKELSIETQIVQDADRMDAIGAVGVARCFVYSGSKGRKIFDPRIPARESLTQEEYQSQKNSGVETTAINHFYEKLLKIKDLMKTETGKRIASERHAFLLSYLRQFHQEWDLGARGRS